VVGEAAELRIEAVLQPIGDERQAGAVLGVQLQGCPQGDYLTHRLGVAPGEVTGVLTASAPPQQADIAAVPVMDRVEATASTASRRRTPPWRSTPAIAAAISPVKLRLTGPATGTAVARP
jgi:hypothetical protein